MIYAIIRAAVLCCVSVSDASGRYSSQYHFGNGFWLGSSTLCREINATETSASAANDSMPFYVQFYVARMFLLLPSDIESSVSLSTLVQWPIVRVSTAVKNALTSEHCAPYVTINNRATCKIIYPASFIFIDSCAHNRTLTFH